MIFFVGQTLITERNVATVVENMNGVSYDDRPLVEYPKGEAFEIVDAIEEDGKPSYTIAFFTDTSLLVNGDPVTYSFDEETILSFLKEEEE